MADLNISLFIVHLHCVSLLLRQAYVRTVYKGMLKAIQIAFLSPVLTYEGEGN